MALLTSPLTIGSLHLSTRLVMPPMATEKADAGGVVSDALCEYYDEKTRGGYFGLVITEHSYISKEGQASKGQLSLAQDSCVEGLARLVATIHANGCPAVAQLNHAGGKAIGAIGGKVTAPAPSAREYTTNRGEATVAHAMNQSEIDAVTEQFVAAALRAKTAGYDGVEIHSAHGYLLSQFYSPITNTRTDAYTGTTLAGRCRFQCEVIRAVRAAVGATFPLFLRFGAIDYQEGGSTIEDAVAAAQLFEAAGIDCIDISGGLCGYWGSGSKEEGYFGAESAAIKAAVNIPVILTGGVVTPAGAERLLQENKASCIGVGRAVLKDSTWARRAIDR